jgi:hypothetical protein
LDFARQIADDGVDVLPKGREDADDCERNQCGGNCILGKFQTGLIAKEILNHLVVAPLELGLGLSVTPEPPRPLAPQTLVVRTVAIQ